MDEKMINQLNIKLRALSTFLNNVANAGIGIMNDDDTRKEFELIYNDIRNFLNDPNLSIYAPPLPHLGTFVGDQSLTNKHQIIIIDRGTRLMSYLDGVIADAKQPRNDSNNTNNNKSFIHPTRIKELKEITSSEFDLSRLVEFCEEINNCYSSNCFIAISLLVRGILDHIPPIFHCNKFAEVANNYDGGRSFKELMLRLDTSSRKISDSLLHNQVHKKTTVPNIIQVDFSPEIDVLLSKIIEILATPSEAKYGSSD